MCSGSEFLIYFKFITAVNQDLFEDNHFFN